MRRIGALDVAAAISERIGSYVHAEFLEFLAIDRDIIHCWYVNSGGKGPTFHVTITRGSDGEWTLDLVELPPGTEQQIETP